MGLDFDFRRKPVICGRGILYHRLISLGVFVGWIYSASHNSETRTLFYFSGLLFVLTLVIWFAEYLSGFHSAPPDDTIELNRTMDQARYLRAGAWLLLVFIPIWILIHQMDDLDEWPDFHLFL